MKRCLDLIVVGLMFILAAYFTSGLIYQVVTYM